MDGGSNTVPTYIRTPTITVTKPSGQVTIANPIYSYSWGSSLPDEMGGGPWDSWPITLRRPVANPTRSNNNEMNARFNTQRISLRDRVYSLFASKQPWGSVSTSAIGVSTDLRNVDSFESIHDAVHNTAGGETGGHMYFLDLSSFDPMFWLHHCNIDRLLSMYQLIVPNTYVANGNINRPMAQWNQGEPKNAYSPLKPFTKDTAGNYFTSVDVKETSVLGYHYPETSSRTYSQVVRAVTSLYSGGTKTLSKRDSDDTTGQYLGTPLKAGDYHHVVSIIANKYALDGSYTVHCFIGQANGTSSNSTGPYSNSTVPYHNSTLLHSNSTLDADYDASKDYTQQSNYVGSYGILGGMKAGGGNASYPVMTTGALPLTSCLQGKVHYGELASLNPEDVEPYLAENLHYKIVGVDGELNADDIPDFHVSVKCTKVTADASDDALPELEEVYTVLPDATKYLPGGSPFTYIPSIIDIALPDTPEYSQPGSSGDKKPNSPSNGILPYPTLPYEEDGYCVSQQIVEYVDPAGKPLYAKM